MLFFMNVERARERVSESLKVAVVFHILQFSQLIRQKCVYCVLWLIGLRIPTTSMLLVMQQLLLE